MTDLHEIFERKKQEQDWLRDMVDVPLIQKTERCSMCTKVFCVCGRPSVREADSLK